MNYAMIAYIMGIIMNAEAALMLLPLAVSLLYRDGSAIPFLIPIALLLLVGVLLIRRKPENMVIFAREGFVVVAGAWIVVSLFGALPFVIEGSSSRYPSVSYHTFERIRIPPVACRNNIHVPQNTDHFAVICAVFRAVFDISRISVDIHSLESQLPALCKYESKCLSYAFPEGHALLGGFLYAREGKEFL